MTEMNLSERLIQAAAETRNIDHSNLMFEARREIARLEEKLEWVDNNTTFMIVDHSLIDGTDTPPNVPVLACVSKRIWYHATDDQESWPFSAVIAAAQELEK
jgi:hypothetical protein